MSDQELSLQLEHVTKKRGRPSTGQAKSNAERVREHRARKLVQGGDAEGWVKRSHYEAVCREMRFHRDARWQMERTLAAMQCEQALLIDERAKLFAEVERLQSELAAFACGR